MKLSKGIYLLLGSNLGDRQQVLKDTRGYIEKSIASIENSSFIYETEPWGVLNQPTFYNQVLEIQTRQSPHGLLRCLQDIEHQIGKIKLGKWRERLIDIDILYYDQRLIDDDDLTLPHPEIQNRKFTLVPMCELNPEFMHPILHKTQYQLLGECPDKLNVWPLKTSLV